MYRAFALTADGKVILGYVIKDDAALKLQSTNIYKPEELIDLERRLNELNRSGALSRVWPDANDPEVQELLSNDAFEPLDLVPTEVVDEEKSLFAYHPPREEGEEPEIDRVSSRIVYKVALLPRFQTEVTQRIHKACQVVAEERSGLPERPA